MITQNKFKCLRCAKCCAKERCHFPAEILPAINAQIPVILDRIAKKHKQAGEPAQDMFYESSVHKGKVMPEEIHIPTFGNVCVFIRHHGEGKHECLLMASKAFRDVMVNGHCEEDKDCGFMPF